MLLFTHPHVLLWNISCEESVGYMHLFSIQWQFIVTTSVKLQKWTENAIKVVHIRLYFWGHMMKIKIISFCCSYLISLFWIFKVETQELLFQHTSNGIWCKWCKKKKWGEFKCKKMLNVYTNEISELRWSKSFLTTYILVPHSFKRLGVCFKQLSQHSHSYVHNVKMSTMHQK